MTRLQTNRKQNKLLCINAVLSQLSASSNKVPYASHPTLHFCSEETAVVPLHSFNMCSHRQNIKFVWLKENKPLGWVEEVRGKTKQELREELGGKVESY